VAAWLTPPRPVGPSRWSFKRPALWPDDDLVAAGGDLEPETLIDAYRRGLFPMPLDVADGEGATAPVLSWWSPNPRGILPLDQLRVTRSMRQSAKRYEVRVNTCFRAVVDGCANPAREHGWINREFAEAYTRLHELGWAHSVEAFDSQGVLCGGLYGVRVGGLFAGESMFSTARDASKVALMALVERMRAAEMTLLDVQWCTDHLAALGAVELPRGAYLERLARATG
jgi:leucyl/phenylalanyl-tRNA--protein transferase